MRLKTPGCLSGKSGVGGTRLQNIPHGGRHTALPTMTDSSSSLAMVVSVNARHARFKCMQVDSCGVGVCETMGAADTPAAAPRLIAVINTGPKELIFHCPGFTSISPMGRLYT